MFILRGAEMMSHASVGDPVVPSISQIFQTLNNIVMINWFLVTFTLVCHSLGYLNGEKSHGTFNAS